MKAERKTLQIQRAEMKKQKQMLLLTFLTLGVLALSSGCTKPREAGLPATEIESTIAISELIGSEFSVTTGSIVESNSEKNLKVLNDKPQAKVRTAQVPGKIAPLFAEKQIFGKQNTTYKVIFTINGKEAVLVSKIITDKSELSVLEQTWIKESKNKQLSVPLFMIPIEKIGVLQKEKNDLGEETTKISIKETDPKQATHVKLKLLAKDILDPYLKSENVKLFEELYSASSLDGKVTDLESLKNQLKYRVVQAKALTGKVYTKIIPTAGTSTGSLLVYEITRQSSITDAELLLKLKSGKNYLEIAKCDDSLLKQLSNEEQKDCVLVLNHSVNFSYVTTKFNSNDSGEETIGLRTEKVNAKNSSGLIQIEKNSIATLSDNIANSVINPLNTIRISDIKGKEFLFRRTYEDSASSIQYFGPGASGNMDIVTIDLENERLVVRKVLSVNGLQKPGTIDREELMSVPVTYLKRFHNQNNDSVLAKTTLSDAEYVRLDWTQNSIPATTSPLAFFQEGQCFRNTVNQVITDPDIRLQDGIMSFSISGTYTFIPECMSAYGLNDYWYGAGIQTTFNIKERVSFKLHNKELDNKRDINLPFRAQNLLGFGVFTMGEIKPNQFGNTGNVDTENALPVIQDFSNGKVLTYTLGGLPEESDPIRQVMINATTKVIADWNKALARAFKGTAIEHKDGIYIKLEIDSTGNGRLGDLDKNYIWNFTKNLDSGLLGMSQAAPNPRSGKIEQNNVLMYSGNLLSYIGRNKEIWEKQQAYHQEKARILKLAEQLAEKQLQSKTVIEENEKSISKSVEEVSTNTSAQKLIIPTKINLNLTPAQRMSLKNDFSSKNVGLLSNLGQQSNQKEYALSRMGAVAFLAKIADKVMKSNSSKSEAALEAIVAAELVKADPKILSYLNVSAEEQAMLKHKSHALAMKAEFAKGFTQNATGALKPNCALTTSSTSSFQKKDMNKPVQEIFYDWYSSTLSHEIGHSLGLTHNFRGSLDADNFTFEGEDSKRNYSSIMDYTPDTYGHYDGPGPYDVFALRAAYTGLIPTENGEMHINQYKVQVLGGMPWWKLTLDDVEKLPIKQFAFCTDIHVGSEPTCNRWDQGTNPQEIAEYYAKEYYDTYVINNDLGDKINIRGLSDYITRLSYNLLALRMFMDETFYRAIKEKPNVDEYAAAAYTAWSTLVNIITTPDSQTTNEEDIYINAVVTKKDEQGNELKVLERRLNPHRFAVHEYEVTDRDENGKPTGKKHTERIVVEKKPIKDIKINELRQVIKTRGIELDKALAVQMLTTRGNGHPRYERESIRMSFAEFEKYFLGFKLENMLSLNIVRGLMENNIPNFYITEHGPITLTQKFRAEPTELMSYYGVMASTVFLSANTNEDKYDFSTNFRAGSSRVDTPSDRLSVVKLDQSNKSQASMKLWAFDNAPFAESMVRSSAQRRIYIDNAENLTNQLAKAFKAKTEKKKEEMEAAITELANTLKELNKKNLLLSKEEVDAGMTFEKYINLMIRFSDMQLSRLNSILQIDADNSLDEDEKKLKVQAIINEQSNTNESLNQSIPLLGISEKMLKKLFSENKVVAPILNEFVNDKRLENSYSRTVESLSTISMLVKILDPNMQH